MKLKPLEELFGIPEGEKEDSDIRILELSETQSFADHPFLVNMDADMVELVDSIRKNGILCPGIARPAAGGYEIIAGHRRKEACILAGLTSMPFHVRDYSDEEATVVMVESNLHRTKIRVSEKAFAYKMHMEAEKRVNARRRLYRYGDFEKIRSDEALARITGESRNTIQRYIRLTKLIPLLLSMADTGRLPVVTASDLSYLMQEEQELLADYMSEKHLIPNGKQAQALKEYSRAAPGSVTREVLDKVFSERREHPGSRKITFKRDAISQYFPEEYGSEDMEKVIIELLQKWQRENNIKPSAQLPGQMSIGEWENGRYLAE